MQERTKTPSQSPLSSLSCQCNLCAKTKEIRNIRQQRKELSLASIYRKDYRTNSQRELQQPIPPTSARKNQSSNFRDQSHSFLEINSTYLANYHHQPQPQPNPQPQKNTPHSPHRPTHIRLQNILDNYVSTYSNVHRELPVLPQESYKIADPEAYSLHRPFPKQTEYSKNYQPAERGRQSHHRRRNQSLQHGGEGGLRLFETTQKNDYPGRMMAQERAVGPTDNMTTLPTSSFLYTTAYKQQFIKPNPIVPNPQTDQACCIDKYRF